MGNSLPWRLELVLLLPTMTDGRRRSHLRAKSQPSTRAGRLREFEPLDWCLRRWNYRPQQQVPFRYVELPELSNLKEQECPKEGKVENLIE